MGYDQSRCKATLLFLRCAFAQLPPTIGLQPTQYQHTDINRKYWWCIKHTSFGDVRIIVQHGWNVTARFTQGVFFNNHQGCSRNLSFLGTCINQIELTHINGSRENVWTHVTYQGRHVSGIPWFGTVNGIVWGTRDSPHYRQWRTPLECSCSLHPSKSYDFCTS